MNKPPLFPHSQSREMDLGQPELPFPLEKKSKDANISPTVSKRSAGMICIAFMITASVFGLIAALISEGFCKGRAARSIDSVGIVPVNRLYIVAPKE